MIFHSKYSYICQNWLVVEPNPSEKWWSESQLGWTSQLKVIQNSMVPVTTNQLWKQFSIVHGELINPIMQLCFFSAVHWSKQKPLETGARGNPPPFPPANRGAPVAVGSHPSRPNVSLGAATSKRVGDKTHLLSWRTTARNHGPDFYPSNDVNPMPETIPNSGLWNWVYPIWLGWCKMTPSHGWLLEWFLALCLSAIHQTAW